MERMLLKGLILIAGIWIIWNGSKGVTELAKTNVKDSRPTHEVKTPPPKNIRTNEAKEPTKTFYMRMHKNQ